jgi:hypothetical protein
MAGKGQYIPSMSDEAVKAKTGKAWPAWFAVLDKDGAEKLDHKAIVTLLSKKYGVPSWWRQMVCVEYERARGIRTKNENAGGYGVSVSKTVSASLSGTCTAAADAKLRKKWFPKGTFEPTSQTKDKYFRGSWNGSGRVEIGFYAKGAGKAQIAIQIGKLAKKSDIETERTAWKKAVDRLAKVLS